MEKIIYKNSYDFVQENSLQNFLEQNHMNLKDKVFLNKIIWILKDLNIQMILVKKLYKFSWTKLYKFYVNL